MGSKLRFLRFWIALISAIDLWAGPTNQPEVLWQLQLPGVRTIWPEASYHHILVCSLDVIGNPPGGPGVYDIAAISVDGRLLWRRGGLGPLSIGPDGHIYYSALALTAVTSGNELIWNYDIPIFGSLMSNPVIDTGNTSIYFLAVEGLAPEPIRYFLAKLSVAGEEIFYKRLPYQAISQYAGMALTKSGKLLLCADNGVHALDENGQLVWENTFYKIANYTPVVDPAGIVYVHDSSHLIALNIDGTTEWRKPVSTTEPLVGPGPVLAGDRIYLSSVDSFYCCSRSGEVIWQKPYRVVGNQPKVASDGTICIEIGGYLYCLNTDGSVRWIFPQLVGNNALLGDDGTVYVGATNLYALKGSAPGPHLWAMEGRTASRRNISAGLGFPGYAIGTNVFIGKISAEAIEWTLLQSSTNLMTWTTVTNYDDLSFDRTFLDREAKTAPAKFFRLKSETPP